MPVSFETLYKKTVWEPKASIRTTIESEGDAKATHFNEIVILGDGVKRGDPNPDSILRFRNSLKAKDLLGTGVVLDLMRLCWTPSTSPEVIGANYVDFIRVGVPKQSSLILTDGASAVLVATSREYGKDSNNIRVKVEDGTAEGKKITVSKVDDEGREVINSYDNLINAFSILYTGSGTAATITITKTGDDATLLQTAVTAVTGDNLNIDLTDPNYESISQVISFIN